MTALRKQGKQDYHYSMKELEKTLKQVTKSKSGGHTPVEDMLDFSNINLKSHCLWYSGTNGGVKFIVFGIEERKVNNET